jgi:putative FmdB family regulatory protein
MPIFEYLCRTCHHRFELLVRDATAPNCPACRSADLAKQWSAFGVGGAVSWASSGPGPCGTCGDPRGPGACSTN